MDEFVTASKQSSVTLKEATPDYEMTFGVGLTCEPPV
jgi:hypothetical protein